MRDHLLKRIEALKTGLGKAIYEIPIITSEHGQLWAQADYLTRLTKLQERRIGVLEEHLRDMEELLDMTEPVKVVKALRQKLRQRTFECERLFYSRTTSPEGMGLKITGRFKSDDLDRRSTFKGYLRDVEIPEKLSLGQANHVKRLREWVSTPYVTIRELACRDKCSEWCYRNKLLTSRKWLLNLMEEQKCPDVSKT